MHYCDFQNQVVIPKIRFWYLRLHNAFLVVVAFKKLHVCLSSTKHLTDFSPLILGKVKVTQILAPAVQMGHFSPFHHYRDVLICRALGATAGAVQKEKHHLPPVTNRARHIHLLFWQLSLRTLDFIYEVQVNFQPRKDRLKKWLVLMSSDAIRKTTTGGKIKNKQTHKHTQGMIFLKWKSGKNPPHFVFLQAKYHPTLFFLIFQPFWLNVQVHFSQKHPK